jgi:hypothetical protein
MNSVGKDHVKYKAADEAVLLHFMHKLKNVWRLFCGCSTRVFGHFSEIMVNNVLDEIKNLYQG